MAGPKWIWGGRKKISHKPEKVWECPDCGYINSYGNRKCFVCETKRSAWRIKRIKDKISGGPSTTTREATAKGIRATKKFVDRTTGGRAHKFAEGVREADREKLGGGIYKTKKRFKGLFKRKKTCPKCKYKFKNWEIDAEGNKVCPNCGVPKSTMGPEEVGKTRVLTSSLVPVVIGVLIAVMIPVIFGFNFGTALISMGIILIAIEWLFGSEGTGGYIKAVFRTMGFIFLPMGLWFIFGQAPLLRIIPFLLTAFVMMSYPTSGEVTSELSKMLAMMKLILGLFLVFLFGATFFASMMAASALLFISFILLCIGFFVVIPSISSEGDTRLDRMLGYFSKAGETFGESISKSIGTGGFKMKIILWIIVGILFFVIFVMFMQFIGAMADIIMSLGIAAIGAIVGAFILYAGVKTGKINGVILGVCGGIGLILGSVALMGSLIAFFFFVAIFTIGIMAAFPVEQARPVIGVPILIVGLIAATFAYPAVMGEAIFGVMWWPTIESTLESTFGPMVESIQTPIETMGKGWRCLVDPIGCQQEFEPTTTTGAGTYAVRITSVESYKVSVDTLGETIPVTVTIENQGEKPVKETIMIIPKPTVYTQGTARGDLAGSVTMICGNNTEAHSCFIPVDEASGVSLYPEESRVFNLNYKITDVVQRGNYISYGASIEYNYVVEAVLSVEVMKKDYYHKLYQNKQLTIREVPTEDTGGPVRLGLAAMDNKMPMRDDQPGVPMLLHLKNVGKGTLTELNKAYIDATNIQEGKICSMEEGSEYKLVGLKSDVRLEPRDYDSGTCQVDIPKLEVPQRTFMLNGYVEYLYTDEMEKKMKISFGASVICHCETGNFTTYSCDYCNEDVCANEGYGAYSGCIE